MRAWMIPWLFPLAILVLLMAFALAPLWGVGIVVAVILALAALAWRSYALDDAQRPLPNWMRGDRQRR